MTTARDIMNSDVSTLSEDQSLAEAATMMRDLGVGALPVRNVEGHLVGMVTDRDIVVRACAEGKDLASCTAGEISQGIVSTVSADEDVDTVVNLMGEQQVKRMPVVDGGDLVGIISEADLALGVSEDRVHDFVRMVYGRP